MADTAPLLQDLQAIDANVALAEKMIERFEPLLDEVDEPVTILEGEGTRVRDRLKTLRLEEKRLEGAAADKRDRLSRLAERLNLVRNLREEAAVHAETDMVRRATEADESEAIQLLDQIRRLEERSVEVDEALVEARTTIEPRRKEILKDRKKAQRELKKLQTGRETCLALLEDAPRRMYESIRAGGRVTAVAALTEDGACGHCYGFVPLQMQNEIVAGAQLMRCEACGVIITAPIDLSGDEDEDEETVVSAVKATKAKGAEDSDASTDPAEGEEADSEVDE